MRWLSVFLIFAAMLAGAARAEEAETLFKGVAPSKRKIPVRLEVNKTRYAIGERMGIRVASAVDGYLLIYYVDSQGQGSVIAPSPFSKTHVLAAGQWLYVVDNEGWLLEQTGPAGQEFIHAIVTRAPIDLARLGNLLEPTPSGVWKVRARRLSSRRWKRF
ncbi:MAG: DUF4384 domain-containing protein [Armatimonadetes bacterium]|nr:DUF4384 domain-containing protein [Armatimonadota bacterium]